MFYSKYTSGKNELYEIARNFFILPKADKYFLDFLAIPFQVEQLINQ